MSEEKPEAGQKLEKVKKAESKTELIRAVTTPLNFFSLAVVVIEALVGLFVGATALYGKLSEQHTFDIFGAMLGILALLIFVVGFITYKKPRHLSPEMADALEEKVDKAIEFEAQIRNYIDGGGLADAVVDVLQKTERVSTTPPAIERRKTDE